MRREATRTRRATRHSAIALTLIALTGGTVSAGDQAGGAAGDWLSRYATARTAGFGGAYVALADEPLGALSNPAGLSRMFQNEVRVETARLFEGTSVHALSFATPARTLPSFGLTIVSMGSGDIERTSDLNEPLGTFSESDMAFLFSMSRNFSRLGLGTSLKVVRQAVEEFTAAGVGVDLGAMFDVTPDVRLGASLLNVGGPGLTFRETTEKFATEFRGGLACQTFGGRALLTAELDSRSGPGTSFHTGTEYWVHSMMALRVGYYDNEPAGGVSLRPNPTLQIDYGINDHELGVVHRLGISYRFGGFFASSRAVPAVFSPLGERSVTQFNLKARTKHEAHEWSLEVTDKFKQIVRRFGGKGLPPSHVVWDGKDEAGLPLPDGVYEYRLAVRDATGHVMTTQPGSVEIATGGPTGSVPAIVG
jgi:hypothetical protein